MSTVKDYVDQINRFQSVIDNSGNHKFYPGEDVVRVPLNEYYDMLDATRFTVDVLLNTKVDSVRAAYLRRKEARRNNGKNS